MQIRLNTHKPGPGAAPGIEHEEIATLPSSAMPARITCTDYCAAAVEIQEVSQLEEFLARHRPEWSAVRWINVEGLGDMCAIRALATKYSLHPLAIEDLLHASQRPKVEAYGGEETEMQARLFIVAQALRVEAGRLQHAQVSIFLGHKTVLTFLESGGEAWNPIRQRLQSKGSRLRGSDASFLAYSLLDMLVDGCFPMLEHFGDEAEALEDEIIDHAQRRTLTGIHQYKRDLLLLRWAIWPMREVVSFLQRESHECISDTTRVYLRDLYDHVIQIIDIVETHREVASDLTETYMSAVSNRMNEVMKVLTIIGTIFIPLTFLAGVYGMNFHFFPELNLPWAYPAFWVVCLVVASAMVYIFRRRSWL
jgi:magnesium transporter